MGLNTIEEEWYLPNGPKFEGQLIEDADASTITLHLYGQHYIEGTEIGENFRTHPVRYHQIIYGGTYHNATLYNCEWAGCEKVGRNLFKVKYNVQYVFSGLHVKEPFKVRAGTFMYPNLSSWFDGSDVLNKLNGRQGLYIDGKHTPQSVLRDDIIKINDNLEILLIDRVSTHILQMSLSNKTVYEKFAIFRYTEEVTFEQMLRDASIFRKLLSFTLGKPQPYKIIDVEVDISYHTEKSEFVMPNQKSFFSIVTNFSLHKNKPVHKESAHSSHMLVSRWNCTTDELKQITINWFRNDRYFNIYEYYLDSNNWFHGTDAVLSNVMFNNRFLNLVQGLEDFCREHFQDTPATDTTAFQLNKKKVLKVVEDPELKKWLNDSLNPKTFTSLKHKLSRIFEFTEVNDVLKEVSFDTFIPKVKKYRDKLSHGMEKEITQDEQFHRYYFLCQSLLCLCILKSLDITDIPNKVKNNLRLRDNLNEILFLQRLEAKGVK